MISVRRSRLKELDEEGSARARAVIELRAQPEAFLATVQVGITVVGATAAAFGGAQLAGRVAVILARVPWLEPWADDLGLVLVIGFVSYLSLVLGELVPKSLALRSSEQYALLVGRPLQWLGRMTRPLAWFLTSSSNAVLRPFGDRTNFMESRLSIEELQHLVEEATRSGSIDLDAGEIASRALEFGELTADEVMVPRNRIDAIPRGASPEEIRRVLIETGRSRLPVFEGTLDELVGYVRATDVLTALLEDRAVDLASHTRPIHFVPRTLRAVDVLRELQARRSQIAAVVDEHGGVSGIVTLEDIIEELVGDIVAEHERPEEPIHREAEHLVLVRGSTPVRDVERELDIELPQSEEWSTIGGLVSGLVGGIPRKGDRITDERGIVYEVASATPRTVGLVRLILPEPDVAGA